MGDEAVYRGGRAAELQRSAHPSSRHCLDTVRQLPRLHMPFNDRIVDDLSSATRDALKRQ